MSKLNRIKPLVAKFRCNASTENEKDACRTHICKIIEKELNCKLWLSANIFEVFVEGEVWFTSHMINTIEKYAGEKDVIKSILKGLEDLGMSCKVENVGKSKCIKVV